MDLSYLKEFIVPITLAFCLGIGHVIKTSLDFISNKYIPLVMSIIGIIFNCGAAQTINPTTLVAGLITGLASTGMYELFKNFIGNKENN